ncbi:MAG: ABC transporter permease [Desulfobacterales bacterium]|nr:ABC transporter permease [Pseudomonadota bacterium]MCG2772060.1 ABC transporter permease [Desulfobacterales bacterium]
MKEGLFYRVGHQTMAFVDYMGDLFLFFVDACRSLLHPPWFVREVIAQMYHLGVKSFSLVAVASFALGLVLAMQGLSVLKLFGAANYIATSVAFTFVRGLGPLIAGIMLASRGGAGMGAELGSMRVTNQIDALTVSAVNPMKYLVVSRILACMLILPLLTVAANLVGILGGMIIGVTQVGMSPAYYYTLTIKYLTLKDVLPGIGKTAIFGLIVGTVGCYHGYNTEHGTFGVGQATKTSVVRSILLILIADVFLTKLTIFLWP